MAIAPVVTPLQPIGGSQDNVSLFINKIITKQPSVDLNPTPIACDRRSFISQCVSDRSRSRTPIGDVKMPYFANFPNMGTSKLSLPSLHQDNTSNKPPQPEFNPMMQFMNENPNVVKQELT